VTLHSYIMKFFSRHYTQKPKYDSNVSGQSSFGTSPAADNIEKETLPRYEPIPFSASMNESTPTGITDHIAQGRNFSWMNFSILWSNVCIHFIWCSFLLDLTSATVCCQPNFIHQPDQHVCSFHWFLHSSNTPARYGRTKIGKACFLSMRNSVCHRLQK